MIRRAELGEEIAAIGLLIGLLTPGNSLDELNVDTGWFDNPVTALEGSGARLSQLVALFDAVLGPPADKAPQPFTDARWYSLPNPASGQKTMFQVVASAASDPVGQMGLGVLYQLGLGAVTGSAYVYIPLFSYDSGGATLIVDSVDHPCKIGFYLTAPTRFVIGDGPSEVSFAAVNLVGSVFLNPAAYNNGTTPLFELTFDDLKGTNKPDKYTSLAALLDPDVEIWLLQVIVQSGAWLNTYLGDSTFTLGDVLRAGELLSLNPLFEPGNFTFPVELAAVLSAKDAPALPAYLWSQIPTADQTVLKDTNSTPEQKTAALVDGFNIILKAGVSIYTDDRFDTVPLSPQTTTLMSQNPTGEDLIRLNRLLLDDAYQAYEEANAYALNLTNLHGSALEIALNLLFAGLNALSLLEVPLISLPEGGIYITARKEKDGSQTFGLRLLATLALSGGAAGSTAPLVQLCLGTWLTGESGPNNWMTRSGGTATTPEPGISVFFLNRAPGNKLSFAPGFELVSLGFNLLGAGKRLIGVNGYTLGGTEVRAYLAPQGTLEHITSWQFGFATRLDDFGFPLSPGAATGAGGNPVAQNLLSAGSGSSGSGADAQPVNPAFSVALAWRSDSTNSPKFNVQIFGADGSPTGIAWIPVQRAFGPLSCQRIGVATDVAVPRLTILLDGGVELGPLAIELTALSIGIPLRTPLELDEYRLGLKGLSVAYASGPVTIEGGLVEDTSVTPTEYNGELVIRASQWGIFAIGSYASLDGHPSMFVFARLDAVLGGPAFFFVTGLCAGFGYNRNLRMPTFDQVPSFPLLAGVADPSKIGGANATPAEALAKLSDWVAPAQGVNWLAVGLQFTSFELIQSNVVLAAVVTGDFQIAILGVSRAKLPQAGPVQFAYIELGLMVVLHPSAGFFGASAVISANSYVLDPACHITGGFAFFVWFARPQDGSADHAGDFVITLGGYHPSFQKPAWYPAVQRLGFSWQVSTEITMQGGVYFALTPSCVMGGGALDLEFHAGDLRAWFIAQANFLFHWKPYYFSGDVAVSIGASYKLDVGFCSFTVSVELGASLTIFGPPVAGRVTIHWYIISFSIPFGPESTAPPATIDWTDFKQLLPKDSTAKKAQGVAAADNPVTSSEVIKLTINSGLSSAVTDTTSASGQRWLVRGDSFSFSAASAFPLTAIEGEDNGTEERLYPLGTDPLPAVGVRPMGIVRGDVNSKLLLTLADSEGRDQSLLTWSYTANLGSVPAALWGDLQPGQVKAPSADVVPNSLLGLDRLTPPEPVLTGPPEVPLANLAFAPLNQNSSDLLPLSSADKPITPDVKVDGLSLKLIADTITDSKVEAMRAGIFAALVDFGYDAGQNGSCAELAANVNLNYLDAPLVGAPWQGQ